jgi:hypothetical protein
MQGSDSVFGAEFINIIDSIGQMIDQTPGLAQKGTMKKQSFMCWGIMFCKTVRTESLAGSSQLIENGEIRKQQPDPIVIFSMIVQ